jgi:hypothetical protein
MDYMCQVSKIFKLQKCIFELLSMPGFHLFSKKQNMFVLKSGFMEVLSYYVLQVFCDMYY